MSKDHLIALLFQSLCTLALAAVHLGLWRQRRQAFHATWAAAWAVYALRLAFITAFMDLRDLVWLFAHQVVTLASGLLLLWAAAQYALRARWRPAFVLAPIAAVVWAWFSVFVVHDMALAGLSSAVLLSLVTLATAFVFGRRDRRSPSVGARILAWTFLVWGLHHLDYPLLRSQGSGVLIGVFADMTLIALVAVGTLALVLGEERSALQRRTTQLEELSTRLLTAQEEERRRIARELHDEAGQTLTALKIELDLAGQREASGRVALVLGQIRDLSELLRPQALDDLGLVPALRALVQGFERSTRLRVHLDTDMPTDGPAEVTSALYRVVQEALTNVARHSGGTGAWVSLAQGADGVRLVIEDDGRGADGEPEPHLGLLGMRERVTQVGGTLRIGRAERGGLRIEVMLPADARRGR